MIYEHTLHSVHLQLQWSGSRLDYELIRSVSRRPSLEQIIVFDVPPTALLRSCSTIRKEYEQFFGALKSASFKFLDYGSGGSSSNYGFSFTTLDRYAEEFGSAFDTLFDKLRNLSRLTLDIRVFVRRLETISGFPRFCIVSLGHANSSAEILRKLKVLLDCFPQLTELLLSQTCRANDYRRWRRRHSIDDPFSSSLFGDTAAFQARYPDLFVYMKLQIFCDFAYPFDGMRRISEDDLSEAAREEFESWPKGTVFAATPSNSPYAWEGLELEQIYP